MWHGFRYRVFKMNILVRISLCCLLWPSFGFAVDNLVIPMSWSPGSSAHYPLFIIPSRSQDLPFGTVAYVEHLNTLEPLKHIIPSKEWMELARRLPVQPLQSLSEKARVLVLANRLDDHMADSQHLAETLPQLIRDGLEPYVLPVGALSRFSSIEREHFYRQAGASFSGLILLGGKDADPDTYDEPVNGAVHFNGAIDREEIAIVQGIYKFTNMKIFGICRGSQIIAIAFGCKLHQDIFKNLKTRLQHEGNVEQRIYLLPTKNNLIKEWAGVNNGRILVAVDMVNDHHEGVILPIDHPLLQRAALSADGLVLKAFESRDGRIVGLQPHPERQEQGVGGLMLKNCARWLQSDLRSSP